MSGTYRVLANTISIDTPSIGGDLYSGDANTALYSVIQGRPFTIDVILTLQQEFTTPGEEGGEPTTNYVNVNITEVTSTLNDYGTVTFTTIDDDPEAFKIRVAGTLTGVIPGGTYDLVLPASPPGSNVFPTTTVSDVAKPGTYLAIYRWIPTFIYWQLLPDNYEFVVNPDAENQTKTMAQYVYWDWNQALQQFREVVAEGEI